MEEYIRVRSNVACRGVNEAEILPRSLSNIGQRGKPSELPRGNYSLGLIQVNETPMSECTEKLSMCLRVVLRDRSRRTREVHLQKQLDIYLDA